ncbi:hypothetical protein BYT27DRAFT_6709343 [Phlegmacium glaucopus]|nr:hypothetical protein BYT27DRAFT_6709343 [Phlegmacium glaucopus]
MANIFNPIVRSNTVRNKPRSPAPPLPATPRPFLPPSHYAAAGGFSTSLLNRHGEQNIDAVVPKSYRRDHSPRIHSKNATPISRTPQISDSESSFEINSVEEFPALRMNPLLRQETSRAGIPDLETHLLPSLRDTIDRMTRPPSASFNSVPDYLDDGQHKHRKQRKRISPEPMTTPTQHNTHTKSANLLSKHRYSPIANELTTPNVSRMYSNQTTPTTGNHLPRAKTPVKSALKSSLRSPAPKLFTPDISATTPSIATSSFKSVKNLLSRKDSGTQSSNADKVSRKWSFKDPKAEDTSNTQQFPQSNSRTNRTSRKEESQNPPSAETSSSRMPADSRSFQSNIPRPRTKLRMDGSYRGNTMDDSNVEGRYDTGSRDKRKLTVTNAEDFVPSSGSESEVVPNQDQSFDPDIRVHRGRSTVPTNYSSGSAVGLGLSFPHGSKREINSTERKPTNVRGDTFLFRSAIQEKTLRFSLPASESVESTYSDNPTYRQESCRKSYGADADHARRRAAFMDIISDLGDLEVSPSQSGYDPLDLPSKHFRNSPTSTKKEGNVSHDPGIEWLERESRSIRRHQNERRRSSSCAPKILASPEDDGHVPIVPPRSRSCQRHASPTSHPSHTSPKNLRELIKNRNSSVKSPAPPKRVPSPPPDLPHRPNFYKQNSPVDRSSEDEGYSDGTDDFQSQAHYAHHRRPSAHAHTEASALAQRYRSAAARQAFGIPPSESDEFHYKAEHQQQLSHTDSDLSFLSESVWQEQDNCDELSIGAESLFRELSSGSMKGRKGHQQVYGIPPRLSVISPTLSDSSTYEDRPPEVAQQKHGVVDKHGENSMRRLGPATPAKDIPDISQKVFRTREAVIQEIFETEENLIRLLHICMRQFILPLRVESSRSWITGVPRNVAKLLDWFDDIVNLHEQIYHSLCSARDTQSPTTDRVSESLRCFVLKAEVYQPYLIRLPDVSGEILFLMTGGESDFGQFINLQEGTSECEGWTFEGLLMLPVHRLSAYQILFSRLLDLTSKTHPDYLSTFSLSRSTDLVIKVMTEVKIREDEYNLIKRFSTRIQGLSASSQLATRDRRLLHSGPLGLVVSDRAPTPRAKRNSGSGSKNIGESQRSSYLADNISDWAYDVEKSGSAKSRKPSSSSKPTTTFGGSPSPNPAAKSSWFSRLPLRKRSRSKSSLSGKEAASVGDVQSVVDVSSQCIPVHAFVFTDLVLLVQSKSSSDDDPLWVLIRDVGVIKPLSIAHINAQNPEGIQSVLLFSI